MFDNLFSNNSDTVNRAAFNLELTQLDRLANSLLTVAVIVSFHSTDIAEESIILGQTQQLSSQEASAFLFDINKSLALVNWINLIAGSIILNNTLARLEQDKASLSQNPSLSGKERLKGREIVVTGNTFKVIGYILAAVGNETIAESARMEADS